MSVPLGLNLIQTQTVTSQSSLSFVPGSSNNYGIYVLVVNATTDSTTTGTSLVVQLSTNSGSSYISTNYANGDIGLQVGFLDGTSSQLSSITYLVNTNTGSSYIASLSTAIRTLFPATGTYGDYYTVNATTANAFKITSGDGTNFSGTFSLYGMGQLSSQPSLSPVISSASRSLNTAFQISTTRNAMVHYSIDISCSMTLTSGQSGTAYLEYADDSGFTTNVVEVGRCVNGNSGILTIGLSLVQDITSALGGMIPTGKYCRIRTANNTGSPTFTYRSGQEVLL